MTSGCLNNRYHIVRKLAAGGFGETFLAEDSYLPSRRLCVIKQLKPIQTNLDVQQLIESRFQREAVILEQLGEGHPQIPQLYAYFAEEGRFYLVQEYIQGTTLNAMAIATATEVRQLLTSLLSVLAYIHARGVIHRDIKPNNVILRQDACQPVLIDFGAAKETMTLGMPPGESALSIAIGTRGYMPPEQAAGKPTYASDLYSLGMTAIYLLTQQPPHVLPTDPRTGQLLWQDASRVALDANLAAILDRAIAIHQRDRYASATVMLADLEADSPIFSPPSEPTSPLLATLEPPEFAPSPEPPTPVPVAYSQQSYRNRQILLNKVKNYWIKGVLETSLHGKALIELGLETRLDAVEHPWGMAWETPEQSRQSLPPGTQAIDKFDEMGEGRTLLILGEPGSGKTTTLLELGHHLVLRAEANFNQPIPVVFNLSTWTQSKQPLANWLQQELQTKYQVAREISQIWIERQQLLLLLDGLDEVDATKREYCVQAINQFCQKYGHTELVVCSRIQDYEMLNCRLQLQGAICLQSLTLEQVQHYLENTGSALVALSQAIQKDWTLQELVKSPLMLSIMTLAYQRIPLEDFPRFESICDRHHHLFEAYIQRMLNRRNVESVYPQQQTQQWLIWLAQKMVAESQTIFLIERLQPQWLANPQQLKVYQLIFWFNFILISGLIGSFVLEVQKLVPAVLIGGIVFALVFGTNQIVPSPTLKWSYQRAQKTLILGGAIAPLFGIALKLAFGFAFGQITEANYSSSLPQEISQGLIFGLTFGLILILIRGFSTPTIDTVTIPNQGIRQSAKNALVFAIFGILIPGLIAWVCEFRVNFWALCGLSFGLVVGGGEACLKHLILRLILYCQGCIPWNYSRFLDYATERIFLQKVGGGYIFVHRLLLEHFAQMPLETTPGTRKG
ncbi:protein kinase [Desertifilum sp. FACHB-1129]|nr:MULTISPECIES: protein kinase [Desertifilum]MBD2312308.1 protein kinase [Desertifilum sp. FACHB-1129]MBD2323625.1 protein kinase [Desertifilum sp. FACHB-866]MBD2332322.1 protein kinase [Desertifilum sp. FACHB-868]MDA0210821.1 protein kinase [Cyanobacteria bacterium FC1]